MGLRSGLKKIGRGIKKGIKKGVKAFDKFDDWIKLKELAQIGQFIPGVNVIAKPLAMTYAGFDVAKGIKNKDLMGAALAGASMYGSHKIKPTGFGGGVKELGLGQTGAEALGSGINPAATVGFKSQAMQNLKDFGGGASNPFGLMDKYEGLDKGSKFAVDTLAPPILNQLQGDQRQRQGPIPSYGYQPMNYGPSQGFSPTTQFPTQAQGGITGDDWHQPINRLPANYEGWVTQPSLATLGEAGKEAVLPLNKLLPAMNKGGLNYSPGQAIVGEAGPEYVTRLGPGEEQYAQSILREQPVPQMREGGVAGGSSYWDQMKRMARFALGNPEKANSMLGKAGRTFSRRLFPGAMWLDQPSNLLNAIQGQVEYKPPMDQAIEAAGLDPRWQMGERYGWRDFGREGIEAALASVPWAGIPLSTAWSLAMDPERPQRPFAGTMSAQQHGQDVQIPPGTSENQMLQGMMRGENFANPYAAQAFSNGQRVNFPPGTSENELVHGVSSGQFNNTPASRTLAPPEDPLELLRQTILEEGAGNIGLIEPPNFMEGRPSVDDLQSEWRDFGSPKERIDLSLLDNDNARYWTTGEGSRYAPERLYDMIRDMGYGDTRKQVEEIQRNARDKEKWYRAVTKPPYSGMTPYAGLPPG